MFAVTCCSASIHLPWPPPAARAGTPLLLPGTRVFQHDTAMARSALRIFAILLAGERAGFGVLLAMPALALPPALHGAARSPLVEMQMPLPLPLLLWPHQSRPAALLSLLALQPLACWRCQRRHRPAGRVPASPTRMNAARPAKHILAKPATPPTAPGEAAGRRPKGLRPLRGVPPTCLPPPLFVALLHSGTHLHGTERWSLPGPTHRQPGVRVWIRPEQQRRMVRVMRQLMPCAGGRHLEL